MGEIIVAVIVFLFGFSLITNYWYLGLALICYSLYIPINQIISRIKCIKDMRAVRIKNVKLEIRSPHTSQWLSDPSVVSFSKRTFPYSDPWRPFTIGFPGIEIVLKNFEKPLKVLFPYGLETSRDEVFEVLNSDFPEKELED